MQGSASGGSWAVAAQRAARVFLCARCRPAYLQYTLCNLQAAQMAGREDSRDGGTVQAAAAQQPQGVQQQAPSSLQQALGQQGEPGSLPPLPPLPPGRPAAQAAARIIRHSCDLLALPTRVACTALTFQHRMDCDELPPERLAAACVFLAAKVEEASVRTNDMLNAVTAWRLAAACSGSGSRSDAARDGGGSSTGAANGGGPAAGSPAAAPPPSAGVPGPEEPAAPAPAGEAEAALAAAAAAFPYLVGEAYAAAKRQLILDEQLLLRRLRFDLGAGSDQPHRHLYVLAHCWGAAPAALRAATCLLNDAVAHCSAYGGPALLPATAAAAALHVGARLAGQQVNPAGWWRATGVSDGDMAAACGLLMDMLGLPQADAMQ
ncbi:hypothetical protein ABPG75_013010 [Micractinium tetrahymenae]